MSKKVRERKQAELEKLETERKAVIQRRQDRLAPTKRFIKRLTAATISTITLLYLGWLVNIHLSALVSHLARELKK